MKNKISLLVCFICIAFSVCVANASDETRNYIYKNDFSNLQDYVQDGVLDYAAYASANSLSIGLSTASGDTVEIYNDGGAKGDALFASNNGSASIAMFKINKSYTPNNDILVLEFDLKLPTEYPVQGFSFPQIGTVVQSWMNISKNTTDRTIDLRYRDTEVTGSNKWNGTGTVFKYGENNAVWYHLKYVYDFEKFVYNLYITAEDGSLNYERETIKMDEVDNFSTSNITFDFRQSTGGSGCAFDNFEVYTMKKLYLVSSSVLDNQTEVHVEEGMEFVFSDAINEDSLSGITISGLNSSDFNVSLSSANTVAIDFNKNLDFNTSYTINFSSLVATSGVVSTPATVTFTTENRSEIYISECKIYKGFGLSSSEQLQYTADDGFWYIDTKINNSTSDEKDMSLILAFYDANGYMVKTTSVDVNAGSQTVVNAGVGTVIPTSCAGGFVKMFLWNDNGIMVPYTMPVKSNLQ